MLSTNSNPFRTTSKQESHHMDWLAVITTLTCLCVVLSGCITVPTLIGQATRATTRALNGAANVHGQGNSPETATTSTSVLNGTATVWTDSSLFPGPAAQTISITNQINSSTGVMTASFAPFTLTDPSTGRTITVSLPSGSTATGQFNASTGSLTLTSPLLLQNVPVAGTVTTKATSLGTKNTITIPNGTRYSGKPLNASNNITLVGHTSFKLAFVKANAQMRITGVLEPAR